MPIFRLRTDGGRELSEKPSLGKIFGHVGTTNYGGILADIDYNRDWAPGPGSKKWEIIDEMRLSDGQVEGTLRFCKDPIMAATWSVEAASEDPRDIEIAEFCEWNLMEGMGTDWDYVLYHFLLALDFGFMVFEKVWAYDRDTGRIYLQKLDPRLSKTIYRWNENEEGELETVEQLVPSVRTDPMPAEKIVHFAFDMEGKNYEGRSILRSAYKHWKMKLAFEKISAMSYERFGMGIPIFNEPDGATDEDRDACDELGEDLCAHEKGFARVPYGWELKVEFADGWKSPHAEIKYHNEMISAGIMQQFTNLGTTETGSRAVAEVLKDPYYLSLESVANRIARKLSKTVIPELVRYNWEGVSEYPQVKCSDIRAQSVEVISEALSKLAAGSFITPTIETENHLRRIIHFPELAEEEAGRARMPDTDHEGKVVEAAGAGPLALAEGGFRRKPREHELFVRFSDIDNWVKGEVEETAKRYQAVREEQAAQLARDLAAMVAAGRVDPNKVKISKFGKAADIVKAAMADARQEGGKHLRDELKRQKAEEILVAREAGEAALAGEKKKKPPKRVKRKSPPFDRVVENRADLVVSASNEQVRQAAIKAAIPLIKQVGITRAEAEKVIGGTLAELSINPLKGWISGALMEGFNEGRADSAAEMASEYAIGIRSGLLDQNICSACSSRDGDEYDIEEAIDVTLPDPECEGGDLCRCLMVYISRREEKAVK